MQSPDPAAANATTPARAKASASARAKTSGTKRSLPRVLIVEDDPGMRKVLSMVLSDAGYVTLEAADGVEALDLLLHCPERLVVLLDLLMPRLSGFDVLARVLEEECDDQDHDRLAGRHAYIVCSAAASSPEELGLQFVAVLHRLGIPYLARPCHNDELLHVVEEVAHRLLPELQMIENAEETRDDWAEGGANESWSSHTA